MLHHCVWFHPKPFAYYCCCVVWIWIKVWFCGGRETSVLFSFFLLGGGGSSDNGKICRFHWNNFLTYCKYAGTGRQAGRRESNANAKNTYIVYIQHALLHVPSLCPRTGCCSRAHTTGNDFSGVFVFVFRHFESSSHAHTIFKNIKTVELWIQCCYAVVVVVYVCNVYSRHVFYMFLLWFFFSVSGRQNKRMLLLFMGCSGNVVVFFLCSGNVL